MPQTTPELLNNHLGGLYVQSTSKQQLSFPLQHTEVQAKIAGNICRVEVSQQFENPFTEPLEAVYVFPLPDEAAVDSMEIKIGDRIIKGNIKKREEAKQIYQKAKQEGRTAGLLEQERDNIFTQSLANIKPGEQIDVTIRYTNSLKFEGGDYEFVFPMVVGPRSIPGTLIDASGDTDRVPDASRITPPVIHPETRSGHDIGVTVEIDAGLPVSNVSSTSHKLRIETQGNIVQVKLEKGDTIPNKDLILRYSVAGDRTEATVLTQAGDRSGHFAIYFIPALEYRSDEIVAKDVVFLMDTSGSQAGAPLVKSQELMRQFINGLNPNDTFTIVDFANVARQLSANPLPNTSENRTKAIWYPPIDEVYASPLGWEIISLTGFNEFAILRNFYLETHLKNMRLPNGYSGEIVFEFPVENHRVGRIVLDDEASTLDAPEVVEPIKRSLLTWRVPYSISGTVRLILRINP